MSAQFGFKTDGNSALVILRDRELHPTVGVAAEASVSKLITLKVTRFPKPDILTRIMTLPLESHRAL